MNIQRSVHEYSKECSRIFKGVFTNIQRSVHEYSKECSRIFKGMFTNNQRGYGTNKTKFNFALKYSFSSNVTESFNFFYNFKNNHLI